MTRPDVVVVGSGPNGLAAAVTLRARGPGGAGPGVAADGRRRRADPRPRPGRRDHARHLLRRAPDGVGVPVLPGVRPARPRGRAAGARGLLRAAAARRACRGRVPGPGAHGRGARRGRAGVAVAARLATRPPWSGWRWSTSGRCRWSTRARPLRFGLGVAGAGHARRGTAGSSATSPPRCSPASRRTRSRRCRRWPPRARALLLGTLAHAEGGWPIPRGGSGAITAALVADLEAHGGTIRTDHRVRSPGRPAGRALLRVRHDPAHAGQVLGAPAAARGRAPRSTRSSTATRPRRSTSCSTGRCRGPCPRSGGPAPCTSAARAPRWPARRTRSRAASTRTCR